MASVDVEHVEKIYSGQIRAISDCTVHVADGELLVVVGPSGCGKSTLLRLLAGLEQVTAGILRIGGRVVNDLSPQERNVAMVFQDYALYPFMSVRRNLEFPLRMRRLSREEMRRRIDWAAGLLQLTDLLDRLPKELSGGQRQRVAMGRALVREPTVSLLDEPLSNLDAKLRVQVRAEIGELQRRTGTTMIYVTHDQVEAMTLGDRVAVLNAGRLHQVAPPQQLYERPADVFVAGFIGNPPMNLFPTRVSLDERGRTCIGIGNQVLPLTGSHVMSRLVRLQPHRRLAAGIRPEAFQLADDGSPLRVIAEHVEYLGHETLVHVRTGDASQADAVRLVVRLPGMHTFTKGDAVDLAVQDSQVYLFDEDGRSLVAP